MKKIIYLYYFRGPGGNNQTGPNWLTYTFSFTLILYLKCGGGLGGGGGGVMFFSHFMLFPTFLEKNSGNTNQLFLI